MSAFPRLYCVGHHLKAQEKSRPMPAQWRYCESRCFSAVNEHCRKASVPAAPESDRVLPMQRVGSRSYISRDVVVHQRQTVRATPCCAHVLGFSLPSKHEASEGDSSYDSFAQSAGCGSSRDEAPRLDSWKHLGLPACNGPQTDAPMSPWHAPLSARRLSARLSTRRHAPSPAYS